MKNKIWSPSGRIRRRYRKLWKIILAALLINLAGCGVLTDREQVETRKPALEKLKKDRYPDFSDSLDFSGFVPALAESLVYFSRLPGDRIVEFGPDQYTVTHMIASLKVLQAFLETRPPAADVNRFIRERFHVYASTANDTSQVLFTGYFEPTYNGSLYVNERFQYPLYPVPADLVEINLARFSSQYQGHDRLRGRVKGNQVVPYFSRKEINQMTDFHLQAPPVAWLENRVDRFFLEIQGSGRIRTPENEIVRIQYAGTNGNPYRSIGRYLIDNQEIDREKMSMQAIRQWLETHPHRVDEVLHYNDSVVFFKIGTGGPYGNINVALTPLRSMATDSRIFPKGALCFVETRLPEIPFNHLTGTGDAGNPESWPAVSLFVMNQDTGGAIRGPARADLFCGSDAYARFTAGHMNVRGNMYFLVMKEQAEK
ncbi:MAG: MltA domain-containing protein [Desulfotignum sp.]|nr:MltA domain-containing protein [Desulfotignum sp.]